MNKFLLLNFMATIHERDAGPQITDVNTGVWASILMLALFTAIGLMLWSFFRRYNRANNKAKVDLSQQKLKGQELNSQELNSQELNSQELK